MADHRTRTMRAIFGWPIRRGSAASIFLLCGFVSVGAKPKFELRDGPQRVQSEEITDD